MEDGREQCKTCDAGFMGPTSVRVDQHQRLINMHGLLSSRKNCETVETALFCGMLRRRKAAGRHVEVRQKQTSGMTMRAFSLSNQSRHSFVCSNVNFTAVPSPRQRGSDPWPFPQIASRRSTRSSSSRDVLARGILAMTRAPHDQGTTMEGHSANMRGSIMRGVRLAGR